MKIRSAYRRPSRRISRRSSEQAFFDTEKNAEPFFSPQSDIQAKEGKESILQAKEAEEEESVQAKEEEEESMQAKEEEENVQAKEEDESAQAKRSPQSREFQAKCHCGGTCQSCNGSPEKERQPKFSPRVSPHVPVGPQKPPQPTLTIGGCSSQQESLIKAAVSKAKVLAGKAVGLLAPLTASGPSKVSPADVQQYEKWFGPYDSVRATFVLSVFTTINNLLSSGSIKFNCDPNCKPIVTGGTKGPDGVPIPEENTEDDPGKNGTLVMDLSAYVFKGAPVETFLCPPFWKNVAAQPGTIIHELAHEANNQVIDHIYGFSDCLQLAAANPTHATRNADNYQFFAETI